MGKDPLILALVAEIINASYLAFLPYLEDGHSKAGVSIPNLVIFSRGYVCSKVKKDKPGLGMSRFASVLENCVGNRLEAIQSCLVASDHGYAVI